MYDEIEVREIVFDAQRKLDKLFSGFKVVIVEEERKITKADVNRALQDRRSVGLGADNEVDYAPSVSNRMAYSSPKWVQSPNTATPVADVAEQPQVIKVPYFKRLRDTVLGKVKSLLSKHEPKQSITTPVSKHPNKVPCRVFKDGKAL